MLRIGVVMKILVFFQSLILKNKRPRLLVWSFPVQSQSFSSLVTGLTNTTYPNDLDKVLFFLSYMSDGDANSWKEEFLYSKTKGSPE